MCPDVSLVDGIRNGTYFVHGIDGYSYHYNKTMKGGRLSLQCMRYRNRSWKKCSGRASVDDQGNAFRQTQKHNHAPDWNLLHERRLRTAILTRCRNGDPENLRTMYDQERQKLRIPRLAAANIPFPKLLPSMQRARESTLPKRPHSLTELDIILRDPRYSFLTQTLDGEDSIYAGAFGSSANKTRCLIFMSRRMLLYLKTRKLLLSDATFHIVPNNIGCSQIWNIVTMRRHHVVAIGSIFMQSRQTECYRAAITAIKLLLPGYQPSQIMCDFEASQHKAFSMEFPIAQRYGCYFHYTKAILLHAKEMGLLPLIQEDEVCDSIIRCLCALPLLRTDFIIDGVLEMSEYTQRSGRWDQLSSFFDYINMTWLRPSRLPILSVYKCEHRTSNGCESYNHTLNSAVGQVAHPNVYKLIEAMVRLEDRYVQDLVILKEGGKSCRNRKLSAICNDELIKGLTAELEEEGISIRSFLRKASRRVQSLYNEVLGLIVVPRPHVG